VTAGSELNQLVLRRLRPCTRHPRNRAETVRRQCVLCLNRMPVTRRREFKGCVLGLAILS
jgi:hypothetical protein